MVAPATTETALLALSKPPPGPLFTTISETGPVGVAVGSVKVSNDGDRPGEPPPMKIVGSRPLGGQAQNTSTATPLVESNPLPPTFTGDPWVITVSTLLVA